jgi:hypothetical protein
MSKPFNIHDWQAKRRLIEGDPEAVKGKHYPDEKTVKKLKKGPYSPGGQNAHLDESLNPEVSKMVNRFIKGIAQKYSYSEQDAVFAIMAALKQRDFDGVNEHHAGDYNPGFLKQSVSTFLDKLKKKTDEGKDYETVEKIMEKHFSAKKKNEASMTSTGASFNAGTGAAYATPRAFKKKNKKD